MKLKENEAYWFLNDNLEPMRGYYLMSDNDKELLGIRNAFRTKEKALLYKKIIKEHLKYYYELRNN